MQGASQVVEHVLIRQTEPEVPPGEPVLEDFRPVCHSVAGEADGFEEGGGDGYEWECGPGALSRGGERGYHGGEYV